MSAAPKAFEDEFAGDTPATTAIWTFKLPSLFVITASSFCLQPREFLDTPTRNHSASMAMNSLNRFADPVYCIMRLIVGLNFASHGGQLLFGMFGGMPGSDTPLLQLCGWICLIGGFLIAFGLFTRFAAFISSGTMAVAYFMVHAPRSFFPIANKGELAVFYCWFFLFVVFYGPGRWSIDAIFCRKSTAATPSTTA